MARVLLSDAAMVGVLADNPLPKLPEHEARANYVAGCIVASELRRLLAPSPADPSSEFEALRFGPEGQDQSDYCGRFRDWTRERYEARGKSEPVPTVLWDGKRISPGEIHAQARAARLDKIDPAKPDRSGLVSSSTTQKRRVERSAIDPAVARVKRMRKSVLTTARLHASVPRERGFRMNWVMVTFTMRPDATLSPSDIRSAVDHLRKWSKRHWPEFTKRYGFRYVWTMELQESGKPHYHLLVATPYNKRLPFADEAGYWPHGSTRTEKARNAVNYIAKYASKLVDQCADPRKWHFPKGFRITGSGGLDGGERDGSQHRERRFWMAPHWARDTFFPFYASARAFSPLMDLRRVVGGFVDRFTGHFEACPWVVSFAQGFVSITAKRVTL